MFNTCRASALTDSLVNRVIALDGAKTLHKATAVQRNRSVIDDDFAHRREVDLVELFVGTLGFRIEGPDAFKTVPKKIQAYRLFTVGREDIDHSASHREIARLHDGRCASIAIGGEMMQKRFVIDALPRSQPNA